MRRNTGMDPKEMKTHMGLWSLCMGFCLISGLWFLWAGDLTAAVVCIGSVLLVSLPPVLERVCGLRLNMGFYLFCLLYAMGPMLGKAYKLYYLTNWWDKLLHTCGGVVFAVLGTYLAAGLNRGRETSPLLRALFGVCFSVAVSAVWELFEFGVDCFLGGDMQGDTVINAINSYTLGSGAGVMERISSIGEVSVNGTPLGISGYLDIGLIDTMQDVLVETAGAVLFGAWYLADRDRHPLIRIYQKPAVE